MDSLSHLGLKQRHENKKKKSTSNVIYQRLSNVQPDNLAALRPSPASRSQATDTQQIYLAVCGQFDQPTSAGIRGVN